MEFMASVRICPDCCRYPLVLMSPLDFIWRPTSWLEFMSRHETTHTVAPDFAFGLVTR